MRLFLLVIVAALSAKNDAAPLSMIGWGTQYGDANQTLHQHLSTAPIDSLILRSPLYNKAAKYGIVILVITAPYETKERAEIRTLWAARNQGLMQRTKRSLVVFLVGRSSIIDDEAATHKDMLQVDVDESYRNLVYKIEVGFRWAKDKVSSEFVAKIDSDTVVHIDRLYERLKIYEKEERGDWLACYGIWGNGPDRNPYSAWYISASDYPYSRYPEYCNGPGYVMKKATLEKIVGRMDKHKVIQVEDVFFTGVIRKELDISIISNGIIAQQWTTYVKCDDEQVPILSILNTHHQFGGDKYRKDLTAAWTRLKNADCRPWWERDEWEGRFSAIFSKDYILAVF